MCLFGTLLSSIVNRILFAFFVASGRLGIDAFMKEMLMYARHFAHRGFFSMISHSFERFSLDVKARQHVREFTFEKIFFSVENAIGVERSQLIDYGFIFQFSPSFSEVEFNEPEKSSQITRSI